MIKGMSSWWKLFLFYGKTIENQRSDGKALCHAIRMYHDVSSGESVSDLYSDLVCSLKWKLPGGHTKHPVCHYLNFSSRQVILLHFSLNFFLHMFDLDLFA